MRHDEEVGGIRAPNGSLRCRFESRPDRDVKKMNLKERRASLTRSYSRARQEQMTTEMMELAISYDEI